MSPFMERQNHGPEQRWSKVGGGVLTVSQKHKPRGQVSVTSVLQLCSQKCHQQATKPEHMASNLNRNTKWTLDALLSTLLLTEAAPGPKGLLVLTPPPLPQ